METKKSRRIRIKKGAVLCIILTVLSGVVYMNLKDNKESNDGIETLDLASDYDNEDTSFQIASNALDVQEKEKDEILKDMYEKIPEKDVEELDSVPVQNLISDIETLDKKYKIGEPFSKEDQNKVLYAYERYRNHAQNDNYQTVAYVWRQYNIGNTKTKNGIKIGYSGRLKSYVGLSGGKYGTNVKITVYKGKKKLKKAYWKTNHSAYGLIGSNGKSPSLGIVYNGNVKSSSYRNSFSFDRTKNYTSLLPCYVKTWGTLVVKSNSGEFDLKTKVKSSWE